MNLQNEGRPGSAPAQRRSPKRERGFTLIETMIAMIIMMIAGLGAVSLFVYAIKSNSGAGDRAAALAIAQQYMERLRSVPFDQVTASNGSPANPVMNAGHSYSVQTTICTTADCGGSDTLKKITIQVTPLSADSLWSSASVFVISQRASLAEGQYLQ
ncbi:MAG TPA: prepilin-type N-terminal cleavage/methylation domain-containing protein [Pyrinomonadaceae bacterium]|jgi:prepilin-type N-terminal cleavage/methylation domain-containing protein